MYIANIETNDTWQSVETLVSAAISDTFTFEADKTYHITNNNDFAVWLVNVNTAPSDKENVGMRLPGGAQCDFKVGTYTHLFVRGNTQKANLHIEQED